MVNRSHRTTTVAVLLVAELVTGACASSKKAPPAVSDLTGATAIAAGKDRTCVIVADGPLRCWGLNNNGQLGTGG